VDALLGGRSNNLSDAYKALECTPEMSDSEIKKVYREKCLQFHPDKLASKGLPDEFMKFANEQVAKINEAYETIKDARA
jgi:DnaJ like chaperone protein